MPLARVADLGDATRFSAFVEYDDPGPFSFMDGPDDVDADQAVAWARGHATRVVVRVADALYTAGDDPIPELPAWPRTGCGSALPGTPDGGRTRTWRVEARTGWYREDRLAVAGRVADAVRAERAASEVAHTSTEAGFSVTFTVGAANRVAARETASRTLRSAWAATPTEATPGADYDLDSIVVRPG